MTSKTSFIVCSFAQPLWWQKTNFGKLKDLLSYLIWNCDCDSEKMLKMLKKNFSFKILAATCMFLVRVIFVIWGLNEFPTWMLLHGYILPPVMHLLSCVDILMHQEQGYQKLIHSARRTELPVLTEKIKINLISELLWFFAIWW